MRGRDVKLRAVGVLDREDLAALAVRRDDLRRTDEASHAIVHMDDVLARFEVVEVVEALARDRGCRDAARLLLGEDAVRLGDDDKPRDLEAGGQVVEPEHVVAAPLGRLDMPVETLARRVEELGMMRLLGPQFGKAGQGRGLEAERRDAARRRIAGKENGKGRMKNGE